MKEKRVVIDLPEEIWQKTKAAAALAGVTLKEFVAKVLNEKVINIKEKE